LQNPNLRVRVRRSAKRCAAKVDPNAAEIRYSWHRVALIGPEGNMILREKWTLRHPLLTHLDL
jgi:hypothetical protein